MRSYCENENRILGGTNILDIFFKYFLTSKERKALVAFLTEELEKKKTECEDSCNIRMRF